MTRLTSTPERPAGVRPPAGQARPAGPGAAPPVDVPVRAPGRRPLGSRLRQAAGVALAVLLVGVLVGLADQARATPLEATVPLFDDDGGVALFDGSARVSPSSPQTACLLVSASGASSAAQVGLFAAAVSGSLAPDLQVTVELGGGGHAGDCTGFTGTQIWSGTLPQLAAPTPATGFWTGWTPGSAPTRTFRITIAVDPGSTAQGQHAAADLVWRLVDEDRPVPPTPTGTPTPTGSPTGTPTPTGSATTDPETSTTPVSIDPTSTPTVVTPTGSIPAPGAGRPPGGDAGGDDTGGTATVPDLTIGGTGATVRRVASGVLHTAAAVVRQPQYPVSALAAAFLFLLVQDRIDRRDPKLQLAARSQRDNERTFPDHFGAAIERRRRRRR